jgi:hypothetical protein
LKQTYNEQILINQNYRSSIFRSQVRRIQSSDEFDTLFKAEMFVNTFITHFTFGEKYNQPTNHLPSSITHLTFGFHYNQPTVHLPSSITHLTFGCFYNQPTYYLPSSLIYLKFGKHFNQRLDFDIVGDCLVKCDLYLHESYKTKSTNIDYPIQTSSFQSVSFYIHDDDAWSDDDHDVIINWLISYHHRS